MSRRRSVSSLFKKLRRPDDYKLPPRELKESCYSSNKVNGDASHSTLPRVLATPRRDGQHALGTNAALAACSRKPEWSLANHLATGRAHHISLNFAISPFTVSCLSAGTMHMHVSIVFTGPPQQPNKPFTLPGACSPICSSSFFFASSFILAAISPPSMFMAASRGC